ncbi:MAG: hypothetical protein HQ518_03820 [Rhodopirellula sp.]|nr:hypothetical protein [Rhodopirellula sp.]
MSVRGQSSAWVDLIDPMTPEILRLVVETWGKMPSPAPNQLEDAITDQLCVALRRNRDLRSLMFYVMTQTVILEPDAGEVVGRMDIAFLPTGKDIVPDEDAYFCLECKRLNVIKDGRKRSYASEYVKYGMLRFVTGQYSRSVRHGGMLGYVLDGDVDNAIGNVEKNIRKHRAKLRILGSDAFLPSVYLNGIQTARESHHQRAHESGPFRIHHMFMAGIANIDRSQ